MCGVEVRRRVGATPSATAFTANAKRDYETSFKDTDALATTPEFRAKYAAFLGRVG